MPTYPERFVALFDLHYGYERRGGHKVPLHDDKALNVALKFVKDFAPDHIILGGDMLDCAAISHHTKGKPGLTEGLRIVADAKELRTRLIDPLEDAHTGGDLVYITGNHEDWLNDLTNEIPGIEGLLDVRSLLKLGKGWKVIPQGGMHHLSKLTFIHGDQLSGGEHCAKKAVIDYSRSIRFGHFHTYQVYTKTSPVDTKHPKTGIAVPCLCRKNPGYGGGKANRWVQGFQYGWVSPSTFSDYTAIIVDGHARIEGKTYVG